ncbi:MAG: polysaccharide pyruvyl transferase family protein [Armatimonadetes bacterium]|nr:polysaccharide pyruvyl transferase family protein [Armatimonadota bacterium]
MPAIHKSSAEDIYIFTRDCKSYETLEEIFPKQLNLQLEHDTALNLFADDFGPGVSRFRYALYAIREDKEGVRPIERDLLSVWLDPIMHCSSFEHWIVLHRRAKRIITNRLHSSIAGAIFGVPMILTANSYHKNRSVWEHSLCQRGVQWADEIPVGKLAHLMNYLGPIKKICGSSVFQKAIRVFVYRARYRYLAEK